VQAKLEALYGNVNNIDVWVGALAEDHLPGSSVGELIHTVLVDQFTRLRDGDPNWYQNVFSGPLLARIEQTTLSEVIQRNTDITDIQNNVFYDRSVLYHRTTGPRGDVVVKVNRNGARIVDRRDHTLIDSRPIGELSQVIMVGSDRAPDHFTVDMSRAPRTVVAEGIHVHGGEGTGDVLTILPTNRRRDRYLVGGPEVQLNQQDITYGGIERLELFVNPRRDSIQLTSAADASLAVFPHMGRRVRPPQDQGQPPAPAPGLPLAAVSPATQRIFEQFRQDLLRQARRILTDEQFRAFAAGLEPERRNGPVGFNGENGPGPQNGNSQPAN
jgi:hypothetical protein